MRHATRNRLGQKLRGKLQTSDVLQTTYVDVVRSIQAFRGDDAATFAAWVGRVLDNNVRDKAKFFDRDRRRDASTTRHDPEADPFNDNVEVADEATPSEKVMQVEQLHLVRRAIDSLDETQREVLQRRMMQGQDYEAIAKDLDRSPGAVRMLYSRARAALALRVDRMLQHGDR